ncbi:MAG TPA: hypothetical protein VEX13_13780 [Chloroflexia bacterium]|nr:hypothetical protein [Chloroflexia bacterium]
MVEKSATRHKVPQAEQHASHNNNGHEQHLSPAEEPLYPTSLLGDAHLNERANGPARVALMQQAQQTYGNRALQRRLASQGQGRLESGAQRAVQRWQASRQGRAILHPSNTAEAAEGVGLASGQSAESVGMPVAHVAHIQRRVEAYRDKTKDNDMPDLADQLSTHVDTAKDVVDKNPLLTNVSGKDKGYLKAWVIVFNKFTEDKNLPKFFYARYGYAIETLATRLMPADYKGYKVFTQVGQGSTRPDFVVRKAKSNVDVAWLDVTSSASVGHIYKKQGGGWNSRPYVAEILYDMPDPAAFATTAKGTLSIEQLKALQAADTSRAEKERHLDQGMREMALLLGEAYAARHEKKKDLLSEKDVREVTVDIARTHLNPFSDKAIPPRAAAGVLASIESLEVVESIDTGESWVKWANFKSVDRAKGRELLEAYGKSLDNTSESNDMSDEEGNDNDSEGSEEGSEEGNDSEMNDEDNE